MLVVLFNVILIPQCKPQVAKIKSYKIRCGKAETLHALGACASSSNHQAAGVSVGTEGTPVHLDSRPGHR